MPTFRSTLLATLGWMFLMAAQAASAQASSASADTLNRLDELGRKQGYWRIAAPKEDRPGYTDGQVIEEGRYSNSKRVGLWRRYWPNGRVMSEITYVMGRPKGAYRTFYPTGKPEEQGTWDLDRNTGGFKRWHPNGQVSQEFIFDAYGVRDGLQKYYHENGQLEVAVTISKGREEGTLKRYYANGDLQQTAEFDNGVINAANSRYIKPARPVEAPAADPAAQAAPARSEEETTNAVAFRPDGYNTLYDKQLRISQQGEYRKGQLWNGKVFRYSKAGILYRIEVYIEGRYAGTGVIPEEDKK